MKLAEEYMKQDITNFGCFRVMYQLYYLKQESNFYTWFVFINKTEKGKYVIYDIPIWN